MMNIKFVKLYIYDLFKSFNIDFYISTFFLFKKIYLYETQLTTSKCSHEKTLD